MSARIGWGELIMILALVVILYYTVWAFVFCRPQFRKIMQPSRGGTWAKTEFTAEDAAKKVVQQPAAPGESVYSLVHDLMEDLKKVFEAAARDHLNKDQILEAIQHRLKNYPAVKDSSFRQAVNNHAAMELSGKCGITIPAEAFNDYW